MEEFEDDNPDDIVHNGPKYRQMTFIDKQTLFYAIRSTMVEGGPKHGIFRKLPNELGFKPLTIRRQWSDMRNKLAHLLNNQDKEDHIGIISASEHILFGTGQLRSGKDHHYIPINNY
jgi:hypothetical protein